MTFWYHYVKVDLLQDFLFHKTFCSTPHLPIQVTETLLSKAGLQDVATRWEIAHDAGSAVQPIHERYAGII